VKVASELLVAGASASQLPQKRIFENVSIRPAADAHLMPHMAV
jgi:hypothetical protein